MTQYYRLMCTYAVAYSVGNKNALGYYYLRRLYITATHLHIVHLQEKMLYCEILKIQLDLNLRKSYFTGPLKDCPTK